LVQGNAVIYGYEVDTTSCFSAVHRFVLTTLELPNVITPNGDGQNDRLDLGPGSGCRDVTIFSRWGNEVFHTPCYGNDWNAQGLADGVYFYVVKTAVKDYEHVGRGTLTVIR
jgi:hypothetical protein